jgi:hypothetical protein
VAADPILVTGAAEFIGFHVARQLSEQGRAVIGVEPADLDFVQNDVPGLLGVRNCTESVHACRFETVSSLVAARFKAAFKTVALRFTLAGAISFAQHPPAGSISRYVALQRRTVCGLLWTGGWSGARHLSSRGRVRLLETLWNPPLPPLFFSRLLQAAWLWAFLADTVSRS